jgi:hypothetical protein
MKSLWKSLWLVCALSGALVGAAGCGPEQAYCPNTGTNGVCPILGDDASMSNGGSGGSITCDAGFQFLPNDAGQFACRPIP